MAKIIGNTTATPNPRPDWTQTDETRADYIKNRTHYISKEILASWDGNTDGKLQLRGDGLSEKFYKISDLIISKDSFNKVELSSSGTIDYIVFECSLYNREDDSLSSSDSFTIHKHLEKNQATTPDLIIVTEPGVYEGIDTVTLWDEEDLDSIVETSTFFFECVEPGIYAISADYIDEYVACISKETVKPLDEKFIPNTIARVDRYDKYDKDSFSANATAKAISAKSAAFGFNTQAGSFAYTVTALDPVAKTFTLDSVEGLEVDDIYTVDLSFYKADGTATEEIYTNYGKITAISADNVVTVDTFPSDVARYRVPDEPYIDENGLDGEENVFRVIAKPNVGNRAIGTKSFAIGNSSQALSKNSVAMGKACIAYGAHSVAIGYDNKTAYAATSFGRSNTASGVKSVAIGYKNTSSGEGSIAFGNSNTSSNKGSFASGTINKATGTNSFAAGHSNKVQGKYSIALGYNNTSSGEGSIALGNSNTSSNKGSFASGTSNKAIGTNSFALGSTNRATDTSSFALGYNNTSSGEGSIALGNSNTSSNKGSFASGTSNNATGTNSFALGSTNRATGTSSFAHGYNNDATQTGSAVFGTNSKSQGESSFAAGAAVEASGHYSQAFGYKTKATGRAAFAEGEGTIASSKNQHVQGRYNIEVTENKYAHIVGNGTDNGNRSNAHTIDWNGNAWFAGEVRVGEGNEKLITETELNEKITIAIGNAIGGAY